MKYEFLIIIRNDKWKYAILLGILLYASIHMEDIQKYVLLTMFLLLALFYKIVGEEENIEAWQICLAYPITYRNNYLRTVSVLFLFQILIFIFGVVLSQFLQGLSDSFLYSLFCIQVFYLTGYSYGCFKTSKGFLSTMGTITVVNVTKTLVPVFLFVCIINGDDWNIVFMQTWRVIAISSIVVHIILYLFLPFFMKRKLYREIVLSKLFPNIRFTPMDLQLQMYKKAADNVLQWLLKRLHRKTPTYWQSCATLEVTLKLHFYTLVLAIIFLFWFIIDDQIIVLLAMIACLVYFVYQYKQEYKKINSVRILPNT